MTSQYYKDCDSNKVKITYSLMLLLGGSKLIIKHGVMPEQLRFRLGENTVASSKTQTSLAKVDIGSLSVTSKTTPTPPPGFSPSTLLDDSGFTLVMSKKNNKAPAPKEIRLPSWLVENNSYRGQVIGKLSKFFQAAISASIQMEMILTHSNANNRNTERFKIRHICKNKLHHSHRGTEV